MAQKNAEVIAIVMDLCSGRDEIFLALKNGNVSVNLDRKVRHIYRLPEKRNWSNSDKSNSSTRWLSSSTALLSLTNRFEQNMYVAQCTLLKSLAIKYFCRTTSTAYLTVWKSTMSYHYTGDSFALSTTCVLV